MCEAIPVGAGDEMSRQETLGTTVEDHQGLVEPHSRGEVVPSRSLVVTKGSRPYNDTKTQVVTSSLSRVTGTSVLRKQSITLASEGARRPGL